jgi:hypothetical protein
MCLHCGCSEPNNRHGNQDSLTAGDMKKAMGTGAHRQSGKGASATAAEVSKMTRRYAGRRRRAT